MYLRFTVPGEVTRARVAPGLFGPAGDLCRNESNNDPVLRAIQHELDWFNKWLPVPKRLGVLVRGRYWYDGICWFRDNAGEMVEHAFTLAALIEECGVPVNRRWTRDPGQLLYRDQWQVVAKPERNRLH